jgi:hypothetical protein
LHASESRVRNGNLARRFYHLPAIRRYVIAAATEILAVARKFPTVAATERLIHRQKIKKISLPARGISLAVGWLEREGFP